MDASKTSIVYGEPTRGLVELRADAIQVSPLFPGAQALEDYAQASVSSAVIYAPPGTVERRYVLALSLQVLASGASLTALALKDKGGSRIAKELVEFGCDVMEDSRSHHRIISTVRPAQPHGIEQALAEGGMQQHPTHGLWTQPGVFSWDRMDVGSALLLKHLPVLAGRGADFGCGIGVLARAVLASAEVQELTLVDIDRRAIACAKGNIQDARAQFIWADVRSSLSTKDLDFVVMNPPFHDTGIEDQTLGQQFIVQAAAMLKPRGQLYLTANRHLPYEALLQQHFAQVELLAEADGFKIYRGEK